MQRWSLSNDNDMNKKHVNTDLSNAGNATAQITINFLSVTPEPERENYSFQFCDVVKPADFPRLRYIGSENL